MSHNAVCSTFIRGMQYVAKERISHTSASFLISSCQKGAVTLSTSVQLTWQEPHSARNNDCTPHTRLSTTVIYGRENYFLGRATAADVWLW